MCEWDRESEREGREKGQEMKWIVFVIIMWKFHSLTMLLYVLEYVVLLFGTMKSITETRRAESDLLTESVLS